MSDSYTVTAGETDNGTRLDRFLAGQIPDLSRSRLQDLITQGCVACNGKLIDDSSGKVKTGQEFTVTIPEIVPSHIVAQDIALDIVYEDEHMLIINKQAGLTVHPGAGNPDMTLVNALLAHCGDSLSGIGGVARPGIVHRIDKETSGLLVVAKHDAAHIALSAQLVDRSLKRTYTALIWGALKVPQGTITGNINRSPANRQKMAVVKSGGKEAVTHYRTLEVFTPGNMTAPLASLIECRLETGRTHQIRVHMAYTGHPLLGDPVYGQSPSTRLSNNAYKFLPRETRDALMGFERQALHARQLGLIHPATGEAMKFECPLPQDLEHLIKALKL